MFKKNLISFLSNFLPNKLDLTTISKNAEDLKLKMAFSNVILCSKFDPLTFKICKTKKSYNIFSNTNNLKKKSMIISTTSRRLFSFG